ncbi:MAG: hypothetical protein KGM47_03360 [Acidobacteriota bacterium]|nr:hypothetical protein [Acidobacteriota bacterium]
MFQDLRLHRGISITGAIILALVVCVPAKSQEGRKDPKAVEIAKTMQDAMGGLENWQNAHYVRYDFIVSHGSKKLMSRSHLWNKQTGDYRLESKTKDGKTEVALFNINTRKGSVYIDGKEVEGADAQKDVDQAYAAFVNDSWWLDMPWNWLNSGVNLKYLGPKKRGSEMGDVVKLTFNHVGLTPGDMYHAFVSRKSHLMTHWDYVLQSHQKGSWNWEWMETNGIKLPKTHISTDGKTAISMGDVEVLDTAEDSYFKDPSHMLSSLKE